MTAEHNHHENRAPASGFTTVQRHCPWCTRPFTMSIRPGRPRLYCQQSCRQRAYERRRGLGVLPPIDRTFMVPGGPLPQPQRARLGYESGIIRHGGGKLHAMRPAGLSQSGDRRITLCGLLARPIPPPFWSPHERSCRTCAAVSELRPSARAIRPSADLAAIRTLIDHITADLSHPQPPPPERALQMLYELSLAA